MRKPRLHFGTRPRHPNCWVANWYERSLGASSRRRSRASVRSGWSTTTTSAFHSKVIISFWFWVVAASRVGPSGSHRDLGADVLRRLRLLFPSTHQTVGPRPLSP